MSGEFDFLRGGETTGEKRRREIAEAEAREKRREEEIKEESRRWKQEQKERKKAWHNLDPTVSGVLQSLNKALYNETVKANENFGKFGDSSGTWKVGHSFESEGTVDGQPTGHKYNAWYPRCSVYLSFDETNKPYFTVMGQNGTINCEANREELVETIKRLHEPKEEYHTVCKPSIDWLKPKGK